MRYSSVKSRLYLVVCVFAFSLILGAMKAGAEVCFLPTVGANGSCSGSSGGLDPEPILNKGCMVGYTASASKPDCGIGKKAEQGGMSNGKPCYKCVDEKSSDCDRGKLEKDLGTCVDGTAKEEVGKTDSGLKCYECVGDVCPTGYTSDSESCKNSQNTGYAVLQEGVETPSGGLCYTCGSCKTGYQYQNSTPNDTECKHWTQETGKPCYKSSDTDNVSACPNGGTQTPCVAGQTETGHYENSCGKTCYKCEPSDADLTLYVYYTCDGESCQNNNMFTANPKVDIYGTPDSEESGKTQFAHTSDSNYIGGGTTPYSVFTFKKSNIISEFKEPWFAEDDQGYRTIETENWDITDVPVMFSMPLSAKEVNSATLLWQIKGEDNKHEYTPKWAWNGSYQTTMVFSFSGGHFKANGVDIYEDSDYFKISVDGKDYELSNIKDKKLTLNIDLKSSENKDRHNCIYAAVSCSGASMTVDNKYKSNCFTESGQPQIFAQSDDYWGNDYQTKGLCAVDYKGSTASFPNGRYITNDLKAYSRTCATVKLAQGDYGYDLKAVDKDRKVFANSGDIATMVETINDVNHLSELQNYSDATLYKLCKKSNTPGEGNNDLLNKGFQTEGLSITKGGGDEDYVFSDPLLYDKKKAIIYNGGDESKPTELIHLSSTPVIRYKGVFDNEPLMNERNDHFVLMSPVITVSAEIKEYESEGSLRKGWGFIKGECNCDSEGWCSTTNDGYTIGSPVNMKIVDATASNSASYSSIHMSCEESHNQFRLYVTSSFPTLHTFGPFGVEMNPSLDTLTNEGQYQEVQDTIIGQFRINFNAQKVYLYEGTTKAISVPNCIHTNIKCTASATSSASGAGNSQVDITPITNIPSLKEQSLLDRPYMCQPISQSVAFYGKNLKNMPDDDRVLYSCDVMSDHPKAFYIFGSGFKQEE